MTVLRVSRLLHPLTALGPGSRVGLWVQGCTLACPGCASRDTWDPHGGLPFEVTEVVAMLVDLYAADPALSGLSLTGGEPTQQGAALAEVLDGLAGWAGDAGREVDVLLFTGHDLPVARAHDPALLERVDAVVAGRYRAEAGHGGPLVATANQRLELLTDLGRRRFADHPVAETSLQVTADGERLVLVGMPRPGDLDRLRDDLARVGIAFEGVSWQP